MIAEESETVIGPDGRILLFGLKHFLDDVVKGNCCFICGTPPDTKDFNNEHVIPDWILGRFNLHNKFINLPNNTAIRYGQYKVPCCADCNSELGKVYETPISQLLSGSYNEIMKKINGDEKVVFTIYRWLCLIFIKTHLKDKILLAERANGQQGGFIGDTHFWDQFHHIHCIARSHYTGARIDGKVYGTIFILPTLFNNNSNKFDYIDSHSGKTVLLQLDEFCLIAVLDDSCACNSLYLDQINKIKGPVTPFQLRQIISELNFINIHLKKRPIYYSNFTQNMEYEITVDLPSSVSLVDENEYVTTSGQFLRFYVQPLIGEIEEKEKILREIEEGKRNYLFDQNGEFINHSNQAQ